MSKRTPIKLSHPVQAHGEEIDTLHLREQNAGDLAATGEPFRIKNFADLAAAEERGQAVMPEFDWNMPATVALIARLADVPRSTVAAISMGDLYRVQMELVRFFTEQFAAGMARNEPPSSTLESGSPPVSILPGSGDAIPAPFSRSAGRS